VDQQIARRTTCFLDLGGGDLMLKTWTPDLDLANFLPKHGVTPVLVHLIGSDLDDLAYLRDMESAFAPKHTVLVLNEAAVPPGRATHVAFAPILRHEIFVAALNRGARTIQMPRLGCMQHLDRRRISFEDAEAGKVAPGQDPIGPTMRQMVFMWRETMAANMAPVAGWLH
jgi:hypothetical protein